MLYVIFKVVNLLAIPYVMYKVINLLAMLSANFWMTKSTGYVVCTILSDILTSWLCPVVFLISLINSKHQNW